MTHHFRKAQRVGTLLVEWASRQKRLLPWRDDQHPDPYHVWLSEIMLQQTTYATVQGRFAAFVRAFPTVTALAQAKQQEVLRHWAGLGYYARARNLHRCAQILVNEFGGVFPQTPEALMKLPGIGRYTAAAIAAIAFDQPSVALESNTRRIFARLERFPSPISEQTPELARFFVASAAGHSPRQHLQAWMDFGETVCKARRPRCDECALGNHCLGQDIAVSLPRKVEKRPKKRLFAHAYWLEDNDQLLLCRRPDKGLLGGMLGLPMSPWQNVYPALPTLDSQGALKWQQTGSKITHAFTHILLEVKLYRLVGQKGQRLDDIGLTRDFTTLPHATALVLDTGNVLGFPTLMKKIIAEAR